MLDMSRMRDVTVIPDAKLAHVGPGCLLKDVDRATQEHGLATVLGFISEVGVAGLTLGGGLGYLTRRFGWTVDNLEEVEIVTADGEIRTANRDEHADLFWALRGAGANFGVVTRFTFRLHEVGPTVYGGLIAWPFERADEILPAYRTITTEAPRELAVRLNLLRAPAAPFVPEPWHGKRICALAVCYSGDLGNVDEVFAPMRALADPVVDLLPEQPYTQVQSYLDEAEPKGNHYYWKTEYVAELSDGLLSTWRDWPPSAPSRKRNWHPPPRWRPQRARRGRRCCREPGRPLCIRRHRHLEAGRAQRGHVPAVGPRCMAADPTLLHRWGLHQLPDRRRGRAAHPGDVRGQLRPPRRGQEEVRPAQLFRSNRTSLLEPEPGNRERTTASNKRSRSISLRRARTDVIREHWDDVTRLVASLKAGHAAPSVMLETAAYERQNQMDIALQEIGKIERTLFMLDWLGNLSLRRRCQAGLNKSEQRHALAQAIYTFRQGRVIDRSHEAQQYRASGLNLVIAAIVYWNSTYAIAHLRSQGESVPDSLVTHTSPVGWEHIAVSGDFLWDRAAK